MEVLLILVVGAVNILCFFVGAKVGQTVAKGEKVEMPSVSPLRAFREMESKAEALREQERIDTILRNIEGYNGTPQGQEDVPGR
jgi:hypothetical protein